MTVSISLFIVLMFSVILHEIAHGYAALRLGDPTARDARRLTLNPISHIDPIGTLLLPGFLLITGSSFLFGWAKPVPVNPRWFRNPQVGMAIVGFAGPATNIIIAVLASIVLRLIPPVNPVDPGFLVHVLYYAVLINVVLATFNMLPIPPLDGSRVIIPFVPRNVAQVFYQLEPYGMYIVLGLYFTGILWKIIGPVRAFITGILLGF